MHGHRKGMVKALLGLGALAALHAASPGLQAQPAAPPQMVGGDIPTPPQPGSIALRPPVRGAGEQWENRGTVRGVRNVVNPTLTPFLPDPAKATGAAVIVAPGGAFRFLSIDAEGYEVAKWLAERGIAAFVLKYRTVPVPRDPAGYGAALVSFMRTAVPPPGSTQALSATPEAVEDAAAAVRLVRKRATEWKVDPAKVGFIGFSAGAMTTLDVGVLEDKTGRPDFIAPIYPPMMARPVPADAPPMFLAIALDDPLFANGRPMGLIDSWQKAKRPLEVHLYEKGGHGFSFNPAFRSAGLYLDEFRAWMTDRRIIAAK